jgi:hypothetical protein
VLRTVTCFHKSDPVVRAVCNNRPWGADEILAELRLAFVPPLVLFFVVFVGMRWMSQFNRTN